MDTAEQLDMIIPALGDLVRGVRPDQLDDPTPCSEFTVRDLLGHFLGNLDSVAGGLRGEPMPSDMSPRPEILGDDPAAAYDRVMHDFRSAMDEPGAMDRTLKVPFGDVPAPVLLSFVAFDLVVHSWDLARATGQKFEPDSELVTELEAFARQVVAPEWRDGVTFAAAIEHGAEASPLDRLIAFSGRTP